MLPEHRAPWTPDQVASLNGFQTSSKYHPYTCRNRTASPHRWRNGDKGILLATTEGWLCQDCGYRQNWAHDFALNWVWRGGRP